MIESKDIRRGATSASNAEADAKCAGRHLAQKGIPEPEKSDYSKSGSKVHWCLSLGREEADAQHTLMQSLTVAEREVFDACRTIERKLVNEFFKDVPVINNGPERMRVIREKPDGSTRLWAKIPDGQGGYFEHSGQPDVVYRAANRALIIEYKTLSGDVPEAPENMQLRDQAVLVRGNISLLDTIGCAVVQPLVTHDPKICVYTKEALVRSEREMFDRVRASNNPQSPRVAGKPQCDFCLAKMQCLQYQQWAGSMVPSMLSILDVPVESWTGEQCSVFLANRSVAQKWLDNVTEAIETRMSKNPNAVPGFYLKPGAVREVINNPQQVWDKFNLLGGKLEEYMQCITVAKGKLKSALAKVTGAKGTGLEAVLDKVCEGSTERQQNKPSIAKREEGEGKQP